MVNCLRDETIAAFVGGALDESDLRLVDEHLAACSVCRGVIADAAYGALEQTGTPPSNDTLPVSGHASETGSDGGRGFVPALAPGDVIADKYEVEHLLGIGGMGQVFAARHLELGQRVAIKVLDHRGPTAAARFLREARTSANLVSDHIPRVFDVGRLPAGAPYLVMEYLVGQDLRRLLADRGPLDATDAVAYLLDACAAVAGAHAAGIVHRDLKPANLFLTSRADGQPLVKVLDFGVSKVMDDDLPASESDQGLTSTGVVLGSPLYMSPEQVRARKDIDARTDVWSLGAILFELLSGRPPFRAPTLPALAVAIAVESTPTLSSLRADLPNGLEAITRRCLQKRPELRFQSVDELARALRPLLSTAREGSRSGAAIDPASAPASRRRRVVAALAIGTALVVGGMAVRFARNPRGGVARELDAAAKKPDVVVVSPAPPPRAPVPVTVQATATAAPPAALRGPSGASPSRPATRRRASRPGPLDTPD